MPLKPAFPVALVSAKNSKNLESVAMKLILDSDTNLVPFLERNCTNC
jgi:hypothetical protein